MNNREIKFRIWSKEFKEMCYADKYSITGASFGVSAERFIEEDTALKKQPIDESENILMQFTGLRDSKGKEIYEGDIVKYFFEGALNIKEVKIESGLLLPFYDTYAGQGHVYNYIESIEVIGNIYENSKLLKK